MWDSGVNSKLTYRCGRKTRCLAALPAALSSTSSSALSWEGGDEFGVTSGEADIAEGHDVAEEDYDLHHFLLGTTSLCDGNNEIHSVCYDEGSDSVSCRAIWEHSAGELWHLAPCPKDPSLLFTVYNSGAEFDATLWRLQGGQGEGKEGSVDGAGKVGDNDIRTILNKERDSNAPPLSTPRHPLVEEASIPHSIGGQSAVDGRKRAILWETRTDGGSFSEEESGGKTSATRTIVISDYSLQIFDIKDDASLVEAGRLLSTSRSSSLSSSSSSSSHSVAFEAGAWDPHHRSQFAVCAGEGILRVDIRSFDKFDIAIKAAHSGRCLSCDFNPNKPYTLATSGEDGGVRFWDIRRGNRPLKLLEGHSHWVVNVRFNPFHDQLVMTSSTDAAVNLWRVGSISSAPLLELIDNPHAESGGEEEEVVEAHGGVGGADRGTSMGLGTEEDTERGRNNQTKEVPDALIDSFSYRDSFGDRDKTMAEGRSLFDSVYGVAWSPSDAWIYASASYEGVFTVSRVPAAEKYRILL